MQLDENPYRAPPITRPYRTEAPRVTADQSAELRLTTYPEPVWRTRLLTLQLAVQVVLATFSAASALLLFLAPDIWNDSSVREMKVAQYYVGLFMEVNDWIVLIVFIAWSYRIYANVRKLGAEGFRFTQGWAIGGWLVPVASIYIPYYVVSESWKASHPDDVIREDWRHLAHSPLVFIWWVCFQLHFVVALVSQSLMASGEPEQWSSGILMHSGAMLVGASLMLLLVRRLSARCRKLHLRMVSKPT